MSARFLTLKEDAQLQALEGLVTPREGRRLAHLASETDHDVVEIGSHKGMSTCYLACGVRHGKRPVRIFAVDPWELQGSVVYDGIEYGTSDVRETFYEQLRKMGVRGMVCDQRTTSKAAVKGRHYPIGVLFIDGSHNFRDCSFDYRAWSPFIPAGGHIAFHDYDDHFPVKRVVDEVVIPSGLWEDVHVTDTLWTARRVADARSKALLSRVRPQRAAATAWDFVDIVDPPPADMPDDCGVILAVFGAKAAAGASGVIASLRATGNDIPVTVVGDTSVAGADFIEWQGEDPFDESARSALRFRAGRVKPLLYDLSPYERTLYMDCDTEVLADLAPAFSLLTQYDFAICPHRRQRVCDLFNRPGARWYHDIGERDATIAEWGDGGLVSFWNSGVIFFRKSPATDGLFAAWAAEWRRFEQWDEQLALMRAARATDCAPALLPIGWNDPRCDQATHIFHWYGKGAVRLGG